LLYYVCPEFQFLYFPLLIGRDCTEFIDVCLPLISDQRADACHISVLLRDVLCDILLELHVVQILVFVHDYKLL
jgi:hypothetical protein